MNIILWVVAGLLALVFLMAGTFKLSRSKEQLGPSMGWVEEFDPWSIRAIAAAEVLGGLGLLLPAATGILPWLTPLAATGLVLVMVGAIVTNTRRHEYSKILVNVVLLVLAAFIAYGRLVLVPI